VRITVVGAVASADVARADGGGVHHRGARSVLQGEEDRSRRRTVRAISAGGQKQSEC